MPLLPTQETAEGLSARPLAPSPPVSTSPQESLLRDLTDLLSCVQSRRQRPCDRHSQARAGLGARPPRARHRPHPLPCRPVPGPWPAAVQAGGGRRRAWGLRGAAYLPGRSGLLPSPSSCAGARPRSVPARRRRCGGSLRPLGCAQEARACERATLL